MVDLIPVDHDPFALQSKSGEGSYVPPSDDEKFLREFAWAFRPPYYEGIKNEDQVLKPDAYWPTQNPVYSGISSPALSPIPASPWSRPTWDKDIGWHSAPSDPEISDAPSRSFATQPQALGAPWIAGRGQLPAEAGNAHLIPVDNDPFAPFAPTVLPPEDEAKFRQDMAEKPEYKTWSDSFRQRFGEQPNLNDPQYDYRGAWQGGIVPQPYAPDQGFPHWPSALPSGQMLKAPDHPTAWMEHFMQQFGVDPNLASPDVIDAGRKIGIVPEGWRGSRLIPVDHDPFAGVEP